MQIQIGPKPAWFALANCQGVSPALMVPEPDDHVARRAAIAICAACQIKDQCLEMAIANDERGVWGGTSRNERNKIRNARQLAASGVA